MRVLLLLHELSLTGAPKLALETYRRLRASVHLRILAARDGPLAEQARQLGRLSVLGDSPVSRVLPDSTPANVREVANGAAVRLNARLLAPAIRRWRPDVIHVNSVAALRILPQLGLRGIPVLLHVHEGATALGMFAAKHLQLLSQVPDQYVAVSQVVADHLHDAYEIPVERIAVVAPFVSEGLSFIWESRSPLPDAVTPVVVGGAGNPAWTKGITLWLLVARAVADAMGHDAVRFVWVGARENESAVQMRTMADKLGLQDMVELVRESADPFPHYAKFDVLAVTSWEESASLVTLEAMAMGIPVVCFAGAGGPPELLGPTGVTVERFSPQDMADSIVTLARSTELRRATGTVERARAIGRFGADRQTALFEGVLAQMVLLR